MSRTGDDFGGGNEQFLLSFTTLASSNRFHFPALYTNSFNGLLDVNILCGRVKLYHKPA